MKTKAWHWVFIVFVISTRCPAEDRPTSRPVNPSQIVQAAEDLMAQQQFDAVIEVVDQYTAVGKPGTVNPLEQTGEFAKLRSIKAAAQEAKAESQAPSVWGDELQQLGKQTIAFLFGLAWWLLVLGVGLLLLLLFKKQVLDRRRRRGLLISLEIRSPDDPKAPAVAIKDFHLRLIAALKRKPTDYFGLDVMLGGDNDGSAIGAVSLQQDSSLDLPINESETLTLGPVKLSPAYLVGLIREAFRPSYDWELSGSISQGTTGTVLTATLTRRERKPGVSDAEIDVSVSKAAGADGPEEIINELATALVFHICTPAATASLESYKAAMTARAMIQNREGSTQPYERFQSAERLLRTALDYDELNIPARGDLAIVLRQLGRHYEAIPHLRQAMRFVDAGKNDVRIKLLNERQPNLRAVLRYNLASTLTKIDGDWNAHKEALAMLIQLHDDLKAGAQNEALAGLSFLVIGAIGHTRVFEIDELRHFSKETLLNERQVNRQQEVQKQIEDLLQELDDLASARNRTIDSRYLAARALLLNALGRGLYLRFRTSRASGVSDSVKIDQAKSMLREAIIAMPDFAIGYVDLASAIRFGGRDGDDEGLLRPLLEQAIAMQPDNKRARILLGQALSQPPAADYVRAAEYLAIDRDDRWVSLRLAEICDEQLNRPAEAARAAIRWLAFNSTAADDHWRMRLGQVVLAIKSDATDVPDIVALLGTSIKHAETFMTATADPNQKQRARLTVDALKQRLNSVRSFTFI
jgi:tetratricopeptide (TPR) repeat protein